MYSKSHALYDDIRNSGFVKLPSGGTLSHYKNFCSSSSGWKTDSIMIMKEKLEKLTPNKSARLGALVVDKVKIQEGLVFDPPTWELIWFTDPGEDEHNTSVTSACKPEENIATHVLQFFFKTLFPNFEFPCAYFLTRGITAQKLKRIFWQGVSLLHGFGLTILLSICDGASENRAFISVNGTNQFKIQGLNRFSRRPAYFFPDPPLLIKKLRNSLYNSGFKDNSPRFTRTLKRNKQYVLWDHICSVYQREKRRRLYTTSLRRAHVELDNLSKIRVKLAVNTLSQESVSGLKSFYHLADYV